MCQPSLKVLKVLLAYLRSDAYVGTINVLSPRRLAEFSITYFVYKGRHFISFFLPFLREKAQNPLRDF